MSKIKFTGIMPALITPLDKNGKVMRGSVKAIVDQMLTAGVDGFYAVGGTGEGVQLTLDQRKDMAEAVIEANAGRGKVIIHTGAASPGEVMAFTRFATAAGADGISSVPPSIYFQYDHAKTVDFYIELAKNTDLPVLIYANHSAVSANINEMMAELLKVDNIIGAKDTRANYYAMWQLKQVNNGDINVINGPDECLLCGLMMGADGGIGGTYSSMPELFVKLYKAFKAGDMDTARALQDRITRIIRVILRYCDGAGSCINPVKELWKMKGVDCGEPMFPATRFSAEMLAKFRDELTAADYPW